MVTCKIKYNINETFNIWMLRLMEGSKYLKVNASLIKKRTYFEAVNNQKEYFRGYGV